MMKVSIITPLYKGNKYINRLIKNINSICVTVPSTTIEWILVNDYPQEKINLKHKEINNLIVKLINNNKNSGIHKSRVNGLKIATGKYVIFLDQDDALSNLSIKYFLANIGNADWVVGNGYYESPSKEKKKIFKSKYQMKTAIRFNTFFNTGSLIISPGLVMIKKVAIPNEWVKNIIKKNGADDWYLWVLLLAHKKKVNYFTNTIYIHKSTCKNVSNNTEAIIASSLEALQYFSKNGFASKNLQKVYKKRLCIIKDINVNQENKILVYSLHPIFLIRRIIYKVEGIL